MKKFFIFVSTLPVLRLLFCRKVKTKGYLQRATGFRHDMAEEVFYYDESREAVEYHFRKLLAHAKLRGFKPDRITGIIPHKAFHYELRAPFKPFTERGA